MESGPEVEEEGQQLVPGVRRLVRHRRDQEVVQGIENIQSAVGRPLQ